jgi:hypothetical protein
MTTATEPTLLEIVDVVQTGDRLLVATRRLQGEPAAGMILMSGVKGTRWCVRGLAFVPFEAWQKGMRALTLERLDSGGNLRVGGTLRSN